MNSETIIYVQVKIDKITFIADLYVLKLYHIQMIIGCDLLKQLSPNLNFENEICVMKQPTVKIWTNEILGTIVNNIESDQYTITLTNSPGRLWHLVQTKQQLIRIIHKCEMCFANNLMELGRTSRMKYDIETVPEKKYPYETIFLSLQAQINNIPGNWKKLI